MANNFTSRDIIDKDILELLGVENMPPEEKELLYKTMMETIQTRVLARVDDLLSGEEAEDVRGFLEADDKEGFENYMAEKNVDIKKLYSEEALYYKLEITQLASGQGV